MSQSCGTKICSPKFGFTSFNQKVWVPHSLWLWPTSRDKNAVISAQPREILAQTFPLLAGGWAFPVCWGPSRLPGGWRPGWLGHQGGEGGGYHQRDYGTVDLLAPWSNSLLKFAFPYKEVFHCPPQVWQLDEQGDPLGPMKNLSDIFPGLPKVFSSSLFFLCWLDHQPINEWYLQLKTIVIVVSEFYSVPVCRNRTLALHGTMGSHLFSKVHTIHSSHLEIYQSECFLRKNVIKTHGKNSLNILNV